MDSINIPTLEFILGSLFVVFLILTFLFNRIFTKLILDIKIRHKGIIILSSVVSLLLILVALGPAYTDNGPLIGLIKLFNGVIN